ncbi:MAG: flagellar biosynthetic protein FliO [Treponema sp.]|nr:flagellar biosynthetic protein FliO [Treponema sp.]
MPERQSSSLNESEISLNMPEENAPINFSGEATRKSSVWPFVKMILLLVLVVAAVYGVLFFMKKKGTGGKSDDEFLRRVAYLNLGQGKSVEVITLVDKGAYLIGVTEGGINLISEVKDLELIQAMNLYADKKSNTSKPRNFSDVLDLFMPNGPRETSTESEEGYSKNTNVFSSGEEDINKMFRSQENRLGDKK